MNIHGPTIEVCFQSVFVSYGRNTKHTVTVKPMHQGNVEQRPHFLTVALANCNVHSIVS